MKSRFWFILLLVDFGLLASAADSPESTSTLGVRYSQPAVQRWKMGLVVTAGAGPATGIVASVPIPRDWPEQTVKIVDRDISSGLARVSYQERDGGVKQMTVRISRLAPHESVRAVVTLDIAKRFIQAPREPNRLFGAKRLPRELRKFVLPSPYIESDHAQIQQIARQFETERENAWNQVHAIFDWVRSNIRYKFDKRIKSSVDAIDDGVGDCEELTSVFIALCRANKIPSRAVWVPGHCYPEFYLVDTDGQGHWIPCQAAGDRQFGSMPEPRPILQKGDNFRIPGHAKPMRYVQATLTARDARASPSLQWIIEQVPAHAD